MAGAGPLLEARGIVLSEKITTGTEVITKENLDSPEGKAALYKAEC